MNRIRHMLAVFALILPSVSWAVDPFLISDIRLEGLQRVSAGTVFAAMPLGVGDLIDERGTRAVARSLFATGNFDDVRLGRDGNVLVVTVVERPSISEINIDGNKAIKTEDLLEGLKGAGLAEGQVFRRATLEGMQLELQRQYVQQGRYDASIETEVVPEPRNRVEINIDVDEGSVSAIKHINVVGNEVFSDDELLDQFELRTSNWLSFLRSDDKYAKEKLSGDLDKLTSYYMDRGYLKFAIESTQVAVSPDKKNVYITINVDEGDKYEVSSVNLSGDLVLPEDDLKRFIVVGDGQTFSQQLVTSSEEFITRRLGNEGYNFAKVQGIPEIDEASKTVAIKFFVDPGKRTYVRRINFSGNEKTADEVLRREMRQMEGAPASAAAIEQSRVRLERLGYFSKASVDTLEVPGSDDLIDVNYGVEEQSSGSISASLGYSQNYGLILGLNLKQDNFMGTGRRVGIGLSSSKYQDLYSFSYTNPYYTVDGVSRGFSVYYRTSDLSEINVTSYTRDTVGASLSYGYPISETQRLNFSLGVAQDEITAGRFAVQEIKASPRLSSGVKYWYESLAEYENGALSGYTGAEVLQAIDTLPESYKTPFAEPGFLDVHGNEFLNFSLTGAWIQSTLNRGILATRGYSQSIALEVTTPGSDLEYYKLTYQGEIFVPITQQWVLRFRTKLGYGDGYGDTETLPFYEHYLSGGFGSVRGYENNTLGPRSTAAKPYRIDRAVTAVTESGQAAEIGDIGYVARDGKLIVDSAPLRKLNPFGGNVLIEGGVELLFPLPFVKNQNQLRSAFFIDVGNVFDTQCLATQVNCFDVDFSEMRYSMGVGLTWITGFGPLTFSLAKPLNPGPDDREEVFQFTLGQSF